MPEASPSTNVPLALWESLYVPPENVPGTPIAVALYCAPLRSAFACRGTPDVIGDCPVCAPVSLSGEVVARLVPPISD